MKQSNKKRLIKISGVLLLLAVLFIVGTLAFFHSVDETTNTFTSGDVHIILKEPDYPGNYDSKVTNLTPYSEISKNPMITNVGINDAFVFMRVTVPVLDVSIADINGTKGTKLPQEIFALKVSTANSTDYNTSFNTDNNWVELTGCEQGYTVTGSVVEYTSEFRTYVFGYKKCISAGETTYSLFDKIQLKNITEIGDASQIKKIEVEAFAIQANGLEKTYNKNNLTENELTEIYQMFS